MTAGGTGNELIDRIAGVTTPTLTTQLWQRGLRNASMRGLRPLDAQNCRFAGPAYTLRYLPLREDLAAQQLLDHPDSLMAKAVEEIPAGAVLVLDAGGRDDVGLLGGNLAMRLRVRGIAAAVTDGGMRDLAEIGTLGLPMFMAAAAPPPSMTQLMLADRQCPVACGGVPVLPGDIVVGDDEGVVVVPQAMAAEVAEAGLEQDRLEDYVHRRLARGEPLPGLYPPSEQVLEAYRRWCEAGAPDDLDA